MRNPFKKKAPESTPFSGSGKTYGTATDVIPAPTKIKPTLREKATVTAGAAATTVAASLNTLFFGEPGTSKGKGKGSSTPATGAGEAKEAYQATGLKK